MIYRFNTHTDFISPGQTGKTSAVIYAGRRHILAGNQVVRQAWKRDLFEADVAFAAIARPDYKVRILDASNVSVSYNPFKLSGELSTHAENLTKAIVENVSTDKTREVPSYQESAEPYFAFLALTGRTPFSTADMFDDPKLWLHEASKVPEPYASTMRRIGRTKGKEFLDQVGTLRRRLRPFINSTALRNFTSSPTGVNVSELLNDGYSIFFNGAPSATLSFEAARIINGVFLSDAMRFGIEHPTRYAETRRPIRYDVDEIQEFATADFGSAIDTVLGAGLRFTLIHHHADQFSDRLRASVETNARIKILGGGLSYEVRKQYAEIAFARQINKDMHRQPQITFVTHHEEEDVYSETQSEFGDSLTSSTRLHPYPEEVQTGWDDYSREQKVSFYAERFLVPDRTFTAILPNGKVQQFKIPTLRRYLYNSPHVLDFMDNQPHDEPRRNDASGITPKKPPHS